VLAKEIAVLMAIVNAQTVNAATSVVVRIIIEKGEDNLPLFSLNK